MVFTRSFSTFRDDKEPRKSDRDEQHVSKKRELEENDEDESASLKSESQSSQDGSRQEKRREVKHHRSHNKRTSDSPDETGE